MNLTKLEFFKYQLAITKAKKLALQALYGKAEEKMYDNLIVQTIEITAYSYSLTMIEAEINYLVAQVGQLMAEEPVCAKKTTQS